MTESKCGSQMSRGYSQVLVRYVLAVEVVEVELLAVFVRIDDAHTGLLAEVEDRLVHLLAWCKDWRVDVERAHDWYCCP